MSDQPQTDQHAARIAKRDQALADLAHAVSTYWNELVRRGVPEALAVGLVCQYQGFWLSRGNE